MKVTYRGREYEIPTDIESLKKLATDYNYDGLEGAKKRAPNKFLSPVYDPLKTASISAFKYKFPNAFNGKTETIKQFTRAMFSQIASFCINDREGYLLSDELGMLIIGKYKHNRKFLVNCRTGDTMIPAANGEYLIRLYWLRPGTKEFRPLQLYKFHKNSDIIRNGSKLFHNGKIDYMIITDQHQLTNILMQVSIMKQRYNAQFKT